MIALSSTRAWGGFAAGCLIVAVGALLVGGVGWMLIALGTEISGSFLLLSPVADQRPEQEPAP